MQALPTSRSVAVRFQLPRCQKTWKISGWMAGAEIGPIIGDQNLWFVPLFWNEHLENLPHTILEIWNKIAGAHKFGWGMYVYTYIYMYMYIYHINVIYLRKKKHLWPGEVVNAHWCSVIWPHANCQFRLMNREISGLFVVTLSTITHYKL